MWISFLRNNLNAGVQGRRKFCESASTGFVLLFMLCKARLSNIYCLYVRTIQDGMQARVFKLSREAA